MTTSNDHTVKVESRDIGATFIELLVAVVLLGTLVVAVLVAMQAATTASVTDAAHARAFGILHDASDAIFEAERLSCIIDTGDSDIEGSDDEAVSNWALRPTSQIVSHYQTAVATMAVPAGWTVTVTKVQFLYKDDSTDFTWTDDTHPHYCQEGVRPDGPDAGTDPDDYRYLPLLSQKITIEAISSSSGVERYLETVISE